MELLSEDFSNACPLVVCSHVYKREVLGVLRDTGTSFHKKKGSLTWPSQRKLPWMNQEEGRGSIVTLSCPILHIMNTSKLIFIMEFSWRILSKLIFQDKSNSDLKCELWRHRNMPDGVLEDMYDGKVCRWIAISCRSPIAVHWLTVLVLCTCWAHYKQMFSQYHNYFIHVILKSICGDYIV